MIDSGEVLRALKDLDGDRTLRGLLVRTLGYEAGGGLVSGEGWPEGMEGEPELFASAGREGRFAVIRTRLSTPARLSLMVERKIIERLREHYPYALYVFSDADDKLWHFVNAPHAERAGGKQYRRIVVGPGERFRTATERIAMLSVDDLAESAGKEPEELSPLEVQAAQDKAFDVEAVTKEFFREYRRVFEAVEAGVSGIEDDTRRRFFVQRLFNRLMFVAFVEKKGWMRLHGRTDYLAALWEAYSAEDSGGEGFYRSRLKTLFFRGFNAEGRNGEEDPVIGAVPYLNGGLFEEDGEDRDDRIDVPDESLREGKVLIFTQYADTARYLFENLNPPGKDGRRRDDMDVIFSGDKSKERAVGRFSPGSNPEFRFGPSDTELSTLVATDVLSEGLNMQDCDKIINYDLHWNPVRLIQRFGRIDRIGATHAEIFGYNFLPETGIEENLGLREKLGQRIREIQETIGEDGSILDPSEKVNEKAMYAIYESGLAENGAGASDADAGTAVGLLEEDVEGDGSDLVDLGEALEMFRQMREEDPEEFERIAILRDGIRAARPAEGSSDGNARRGAYVYCRAGSQGHFYFVDASSGVAEEGRYPRVSQGLEV